MKILSNENIMSVMANSTTVLANSTIVYANTTTYSIVSNINLIPRQSASNVTVVITDELTNKKYESIGWLIQDSKTFKLNFESLIPFKFDNVYKLQLFDNQLLIYNQKLFVTDKRPQNFSY